MTTPTAPHLIALTTATLAHMRVQMRVLSLCLFALTTGAEHDAQAAQAEYDRLAEDESATLDAPLFPQESK